MTTFIPATNGPPETRQSRDAATWLGLAASPTFALMACVPAHDMQATMCASGAGFPPIDGMAWMYLLMSVFHLSPWLKLASAFSRQLTRPKPQIQRD